MSKNILLIEDDLDIQRIYSQKLSNKGYKVVIAIDVQSGLTCFNNERPDLVLLDIMLPGKMNGFDLLEILKKNDETKATPVIVMTNLDTEKDQAIKIGANDYLIKANTSLEDLAKKVKGFIG